MRGYAVVLRGQELSSDYGVGGDGGVVERASDAERRLRRFRKDGRRIAVVLEARERDERAEYPAHEVEVRAVLP